MPKENPYKKPNYKPADYEPTRTSYVYSADNIYSDEIFILKIVFLIMSIVIILVSIVIGQILQYNKFNQSGEINILCNIFDLSKEPNLLWVLITTTFFNVSFAIAAIFIVFALRRLDVGFYIWVIAIDIIWALYLILAPCFGAIVLFAIAILTLAIIKILEWCGAVYLEDLMDKFFEAVFG